MNSRNLASAATAACPRRRSQFSLGSAAALITMLASPFFEPQARAQTYTGNDATGGPFSSGNQSFRDNSALNAATANAVSGGRQTFQESSVLNASVGGGISGGEQEFYDSSALNVTAANAIGGGEQTFSDTSMLNASAGDAISRGNQYFYGSATLNATATSAVSGGTQDFAADSILNASAGRALNGGEQFFNGSSVLNATVSGAVSGGFQTFYGTSQLNAQVAGAISGGTQDFFGSSRLNASVAGAVGAGVKYFSNSSVLDVQSDNALTNRVDVRFDLFGGPAPGGILRLNGHSTVVGRINSEAAGAGIITNDGAADSVLTVDSSLLANSSFSGLIQDGGAGALGLVKTGAGTLRLSGANTYRGGTTVTGGILQVSRDANLGAASGGLTLNGGTLATTASFDSGRTVTLAGAGQFDVAANTELGLIGAMAGTGDLIKSGAGALRLDRAGNAYGNTRVLAGTLIGNTASLSGDIGNAATVVFNQAADGGYAGAIGGLGGVNGRMVKQGGGTLTLTGASALDWSVQAGALSSAAERFSGNAAISPGATLILDQTVDATYGGALSGGGSLIKRGAGALIQAGNSVAFTGSTVVSAGSLIVGADAARAAAVLGGSVSVQDGARLGGHGTVGSGAGSVVTVEPGGTLAPGNSIGTFTVNGELVVARGARYEVEVDPAGKASDLTRVTGKATLNGGSVALVGNGGSYALRSTYTILTADQGLSGAFEGVASRYAFLDPTLSYDANNAYLNLARNDVSFVDAARTRNQAAVARAIERIGVNAANPVYDAVVQLPTAVAARGAFDQLSGEILASARTALIEDSRHVREAVTDRLRAAWGGAGVSTESMTLHGRQAEAAQVGPDGKAGWSRGFGAWGRTGSDGNAARLNHSAGGFLLGTDARLSQHWRAGALAGYSRTRFDVGNASGSSDNFHLGLYGGAQWGRLGLRLGAAHTWHALRVSRPVAFAGYADALKADYRAGTTQVFGDLGYRIDTAVAAVEPFVSAAYVNLRTGRIDERGGAAALRARGQDTGVGYTTLGLRASGAFTLGRAAATARASVGWRHALGDTTPASAQRFAGGDAFTAAGVPIARNAALIEAGMDVTLGRGTALGLAYSGMIGSSARDHGVKASLGIRF